MRIHLSSSPARPMHAVARGVLLLALAGAMSAMTAAACTGSYPGGNANLVIDTWDDADAGKLISAWDTAGNANFLNGCSFSDPTPVDVTPAMPNLQFVRNVTVDGQSYPAFTVVGQPRSPLLIFRYLIGNGAGGISTVPLDVSRTFHSTGDGVIGNFRWSVVSVAAVSRGGQMEDLPTTAMGSITHVYPPNPSLTKVETFSVTAKLRTKTCELTDAPVKLDDVYAADLPAANSTTGEKTFNVSMRCNGAFPVSLVLTDANAPGNTGSRLTPTRNATAQGVRVQLLREGAPVVLGDSWPLPTSQNGPQDIPLAARYYREAGTYGSGAVEGQAIITASYR
jgi:type 1 fimbria pilin